MWLKKITDGKLDDLMRESEEVIGLLPPLATFVKKIQMKIDKAVEVERKRQKAAAAMLASKLMKRKRRTKRQKKLRKKLLPIHRIPPRNHRMMTWPLLMIWPLRKCSYLARNSISCTLNLVYIVILYVCVCYLPFLVLYFL